MRPKYLKPLLITLDNVQQTIGTTFESLHDIPVAAYVSSSCHARSLAKGFQLLQKQ